MNTIYHSDWMGKAIVAVISAIVLLIVAAFLLGSMTSEQLQWLHPQIAQAIADFKREQTRNLQLTNDQLQEEIRGRQIENKKRQALADIEIADRRTWSTEWPKLLQTLVAAIADAIRVMSVGFILLIGYKFFQQYRPSVSRYPARAPATVLPFRQPSTRTYAFEIDSLIETNGLIVRPETPAERARYQFLRELGRRREAELRAARNRSETGT